METLKGETTQSKYNNTNKHKSSNKNTTSSSSITTTKDNVNVKTENKYLNYIMPLLIILSCYLYILSLKGCEGTQTYCLVTLDPWFFYNLGIYLAISAFIIVLQITWFYYGKISFIHFIYTIPIYYYLFYHYDIGSDLTKHGAYNRVIFYIMILLLGMFTSIYLSLRYMRLNKYYKTLLCILLSTIAIAFTIKHKVHSGCATWYNGMNGMKVENDMQRDKCYITHPKSCWVNMLDGLFDVSWIIGEDCSNFRKGERLELIKYLNKSKFNSTYNFAYPITTNYTWLNESHFDRFFHNIMRDMKDLDKDSSSFICNDNYCNKPEIELKFDKQTQLGHIEMNIHKNMKLVNERKAIYDKLPKENKPKYKNFLFIYIDALSRAHFMRKMKHTQTFLNKYYSKQLTSNSVYQMMKYHAFIYYTPPNVNPMFYGESMFNANGTNIIRAFKERGFITGQSNNICSRELYDLENDYTKDMDFESFDHENIAMFCDPNFHNLENPFTPYLGPYSIKRRCLYGKDTFAHVLDYGELFWDTYQNESKFLRVAFQDAHEGTGEVVKYLDERLGKFLNSFLQKGYLEDTAVFIVSDHGNNMIGFYNVFQVEDFVMEKTLASWFILLPNKETKEEINNIIDNQQKIVTPYDIHDTMLDVIGYGSQSKYHSRFGQSIYKSINNKERDCLRYKQDLEDKWCRCINY